MRISKKVKVRGADETRELIKQFMSFEICHVNRVEMQPDPFPQQEFPPMDQYGNPIEEVYEHEEEIRDPADVYLEENEDPVSALPRRTKKKSACLDAIYHGISDDELSNSEEEDSSSGRSVYSDECDREIEDDEYDEYDW